ncbi:Gfo/Idh/MocA family oxidoreductase [Candidatus Micrarchaeota archaeon]|nr:Gfo/Idh/MocA family oxidoreductase [Candidatus Micrarchaeota archaeon]
MFMKNKKIAVIGGAGDVVKTFYHPAGLFIKAKKMGYDLVCIDIKPKIKIDKTLLSGYTAVYGPSSPEIKKIKFFAALIVTPPQFHYAWASWAVKKKVPHVFIEKPIVAPKDLKHFANLLKRNNSQKEQNTIFYGIDWIRNNGAVTEAFKHLAEIGEIEEISGILVESVPVERNRKQLLEKSANGGGMSQDMAVHVLFLVLELLGKTKTRPKVKVEIKNSEFFKLVNSEKIGIAETAARLEFDIKSDAGKKRVRIWCGKGLSYTEYVIRIKGKNAEMIIELGQHDVNARPKVTVKSKTRVKNYSKTKWSSDLGYREIVSEIFNNLSKPKEKNPSRNEIIKNMSLAVDILHQASIIAAGKHYEKPLIKYKMGTNLWKDDLQFRKTSLIFSRQKNEEAKGI